MHRCNSQFASHKMEQNRNRARTRASATVWIFVMLATLGWCLLRTDKCVHCQMHRSTNGKIEHFSPCRTESASNQIDAIANFMWNVHLTGVKSHTQCNSKCNLCTIFTAQERHNAKQSYCRNIQNIYGSNSPEWLLNSVWNCEFEARNKTSTRICIRISEVPVEQTYGIRRYPYIQFIDTEILFSYRHHHLHQLNCVSGSDSIEECEQSKASVSKWHLTNVGRTDVMALWAFLKLC